MAIGLVQIRSMVLPKLVLMQEVGGFIWSGFIGGRYFFSDNFAGMLELGSDIAYMNLDVAFKF